jgi:hypothetical protein
MREIKFSVPIYEAEVCYLIGGTIPELASYIKAHHGNSSIYSWNKRCDDDWKGEDADTTDGYQFHINSPLGIGEVFYVWVHKPTQYLLFHETFHLVGDIMQTRGIGYCYESEEAYAYLGGWIYEKISEEIII